MSHNRKKRRNKKKGEEVCGAEQKKNGETKYSKAYERSVFTELQTAFRNALFAARKEHKKPSSARSMTVLAIQIHGCTLLIHDGARQLFIVADGKAAKWIETGLR